MAGMTKEFSEQKYYAGFKRIRNQLRLYPVQDVVGFCLDYLNQPVEDKVTELKRNPWLVLLVIKWVLIDKECRTIAKKKLDRPLMYSILQTTHELGNIVRMPTDFSNIHLFIRNVSHQQFIYQSDISSSYLARQSILFSRLPKNHMIQDKFIELTGLTISQFLDFSFITVAWTLENHSKEIPITWYRNVEGVTDIDINNYILSISKPMDELRKWLVDRDDGKRHASEFYEQTPFISMPFIRTETTLLGFHPQILYRSIENFVYDKLRGWDSQKFMSKFGTVFEHYIEECIQRTGLEYLNEKQVMKRWGTEGKQIDFIVSDGDTNIFIDAKAVEASSRGKIAYSSCIVEQETKDSVIKAIEQAHDVLRKMHNSGDEVKCRNFLLVVTFKELYLGNGETFYNSIAKQKIDSIYDKYSETPCIPVENIYFIAINDFDLFMEMVSKHKVGFAEGIEKAIQRDRAPETKLFTFLQHMVDWKLMEEPSHLKVEFERNCNRLIDDHFLRL